MTKLEEGARAEAYATMRAAVAAALKATLTEDMIAEAAGKALAQLYVNPYTITSLLQKTVDERVAQLLKEDTTLQAEIERVSCAAAAAATASAHAALRAIKLK